MAKKAAKEEPLSDDFNERIIREIDKEYGEGLIVGGDELINEKLIVVPASPSINIITSGGFQEGCWIGIAGPEKIGKTVLALTIAANAQKPEFGNRTVFFADVEARLSQMHASGIKGLITSSDRFKIIKSKKGTILNSQQWLDIIMRVIKTVPGCVVIIDSLSAMCEPRVMEEGIGTETRGGGNRWQTQFVELMASTVPINKCIVIGLSRMIANTGAKMGAPQKIEKSSNAWKHQCDYILRAIMKQPWKEDGRQVGQIVTWACNCSKLGPPGMRIESYLRYGIGFDSLYESIVFGETIQLIEKSGSWYTLSFLAGEDYKHLLTDDVAPKRQGREQIYQLLLANPAWAEALQTEVVKNAISLAGAGGGDD